MRQATYCMSKPPPSLRAHFQLNDNSKPTPNIPANLYANSSCQFKVQTNIYIYSIYQIHKITRVSFLSLTENQETHKMMNFLALGLVLTSLVSAGFFTPTPQNPKSRDDSVIVKEGHRTVVVEYEKDDGNTKVSISPQDSPTAADGKGPNNKLSEKFEGVKEEVKGAASSVLDEARNQEEEVHPKFRPRELVCDVYGKCKHKIASALGKTKETVAEAAEKVYEAEEAARESVSEAAGKVKDTVTHTAHKASDKAREAKESVKDSAAEVSSKAKEKVSEKAGGAKEMAAEKARAAESVKRVKKQGQKDLGEILQHARELAADAFDYVAPPERVAPVAGVVHLMGFAAAYGMCVWITFVSSYVLARALPRQQFAMVQSKIYPVYFKAMGYCVGMALLGHLMGPRRRSSPASVVVFEGLNLASSLAMILTNLLWLEPRATKVMLERMKKDKEEGAGKEGHTTEPTAAETAAGRGPTGEEAAARSQRMQLNQTLQKFNSYSSFLNAATLVSLTWHLVHLGYCLHATC